MNVLSEEDGTQVTPSVGDEVTFEAKGTVTRSDEGGLLVDISTVNGTEVGYEDPEAEVDLPRPVSEEFNDIEGREFARAAAAAEVEGERIS